MVIWDWGWGGPGPGEGETAEAGGAGLAIEEPGDGPEGAVSVHCQAWLGHRPAARAGAGKAGGIREPVLSAGPGQGASWGSAPAHPRGRP